MVLAADTEITYGQESKTEGGKIYWVADGPVNGASTGFLAVTGAGSTSYIEAAYSEMKEIFLSDPRDSAAGVGRKFKTFLREFHQNHIWPSATTSIDRQDIWLIVVVRRKSELKIWVTDGSTMRIPLRRHASVGIGDSQARDLLNFLDKRLDTDTAMAVAAYAVYRVKQIVQGVGKNTHVVCLAKTGMPFGLNEDQIDELEKLFKFYRGLESQLVHWALGSKEPFAEGKRVHDLIDHARGEIGKHLTHNSPINSDMSVVGQFEILFLIDCQPKIDVAFSVLLLARDVLPSLTGSGIDLKYAGLLYGRAL